MRFNRIYFEGASAIAVFIKECTNKIQVKLDEKKLS